MLVTLILLVLLAIGHSNFTFVTSIPRLALYDEPFGDNCPTTVQVTPLSFEVEKTIFRVTLPFLE